MIISVGEVVSIAGSILVILLVEGTAAVRKRYSQPPERVDWLGMMKYLLTLCGLG